MKKVIPFSKTITFRTMIAEITDIEVSHDLVLKENNEIEGNILVDGKYKMTDASQIEEEFHYQLPFTIEIDQKYDLTNFEITIGDFYFEIINEEDLKINVEVDLDGMEEKKIEVEHIATKISLDEIQDKVEELEEIVEEANLVRNKDDIVEVPVEHNETIQKLELEKEKSPLEQLSYEIEQDVKGEVEEIDMEAVETTEVELPSFYQNPVKEKNMALPDKIVEETPLVEAKEISLPNSNVSSIFSSLTSNEETFSTYYVYIVRETDTLDSIIEKYQTTKEQLQDYNDLSDIKLGSKLIIPCTNNE